MKRTLLFIPYFNDSIGLTRSIESLPNQADIDLLVIDDGSSVLFDTKRITQLLHDKELNLELIKHEQNRGITDTRNHALNYFKKTGYQYLMFLDCGDEISPKRIDLQIAFLDEHPDSMIVGSHVHFVDEKRAFLFDLTLPTSWQEIRKKMYLNSMLIQPAITLRASLLDTHNEFPANYSAAEDYAYFMSVIQTHRVDNIPQFLTTTFVNLKGISNTNRKKQVISRIRIILKYFRFGYYPIIGLLRSCLMLFIPLRITAYVKGLLYSNESKS